MIWIACLCGVLHLVTYGNGHTENRKSSELNKDYYGLDAILDNQHQLADPSTAEEQELWLDDFTNDKDYLYEMQSDAAGEGITQDESTCPPPPKELPRFGCDVNKCKSDKECTNAGHRCCFNGCAFTCMPTMPPPPVVDWKREPPRRLRSGNSWLVPGPDDTETGKQLEEDCSTNDILEDEDALMCPHGFICHIEDPGNPGLGIPNRGTCIKERSKIQTHRGRRFRLKNFSLQKGVCVFENAIYVDGATFRYEQHPCTCKEGAITCAVGKPRHRNKH